MIDEKAQVEFLEERLLKRLPEPYRTLLERGPILRLIDQSTLNVLLNTQLDGLKAKSVKLDDRTYTIFLRYPFIDRQLVIKNKAVTQQLTFHELVRRVRLETLQKHHTETREQLHLIMASYYYDELLQIQQRHQKEHLETNTQQKNKTVFPAFFKKIFKWSKKQPKMITSEVALHKNMKVKLGLISEEAFETLLEYIYHALQVKRLQIDVFEIWQKSVLQTAVTWRKDQAKLLLNIIGQLIEENEPFLSKTGIYYAQYLLLLGKILGVDLRWEECLSILMEALQIFEDNKNTDHLAACYNNIGYTFVNLGKLEQALEYFNQAITIANQEDSDTHSSCLNNIGYIYVVKGELEKALEFQLQALEIAKQAKNDFEMAICLDNIGSTYQARGEMQKAKIYHLQSLKIFTQIKHLPHMAQCLNNIGEIYRIQGEPKEALIYYERALKISDSLDDPVSKASTLNNIGCVYDDLSDPERALNYYNSSLELIEGKSPATTNMAQTVNNIGLVYLYKQKLEEARTYFERGLVFSEEVGNKAHIALSCNHLGIVYFHQAKFEQAEKYYRRSLILREEIGNSADIARISHNIGEFYFRSAIIYPSDAPINTYTYIPFQAKIVPPNIYIKRPMLKKAMEQFEKALKFYELAGKGFEPDIADELENLALCNMLLKEQEKAISYCRRAKKIREITKDMPHHVYTGKSSSIEVQITEDFIRKFSLQVYDSKPQHATHVKKSVKKRKRHH